MRISKIIFNNFRLYKGENQIIFNLSEPDKNINIVAGKNGFGKTTFLTALVWCFYGKMMAEVEEKYKKDIKNAGGYERFLKNLLNRDVQNAYLANQTNFSSLSVEVELSDISIPSLPCEHVVIKRWFFYKNTCANLPFSGIKSTVSRMIS